MSNGTSGVNRFCKKFVYVQARCRQTDRRKFDLNRETCSICNACQKVLHARVADFACVRIICVAFMENRKWLDLLCCGVGVESFGNKLLSKMCILHLQHLAITVTNLLELWKRVYLVHYRRQIP